MKKKLSFEEAMKQLEETVEKLSSGNLPLDDMMKLYEEGEKLSKYCLEQLDGFDKKLSGVEMLRDADTESEK